jgi:hypothetical protein
VFFGVSLGTVNMSACVVILVVVELCAMASVCIIEINAIYKKILLIAIVGSLDVGYSLEKMSKVERRQSIANAFNAPKVMIRISFFI